VEAKNLKASILDYMNSTDFNPTFEVPLQTMISQFSATPNEIDVASASNGATLFKSGDTKTSIVDYDGLHKDRLMEINDGVVNLAFPNRSWSDYSRDSVYSTDATIGVNFKQEYIVDSVQLYFSVDDVTEVPQTVVLQYWDGSKFAEVTNQSPKSGFVRGLNTIRFDKVGTTKLQVVMKHAPNKAIAVSEITVNSIVGK
jgi:hypothetical protein